MRLCAGILCLLLAASACDRGGDRPPPPELSVQLEAPIATNARTVVVRAVVSGEATSVELARDGIVLGELLPPYEHVWRTDGFADGAYAFVARVRQGDEEAVSAPCIVALDRVGPVLAGATPRPGTLLSPPWPDITVAFDEPLDRASFQPADVSLTSASFSGQIPAIVTLDPDDRTVRVRPTSWGTAPITVRIADVTDVAHNALAAPVVVQYPSTSARVLASGTEHLASPRVAVDTSGRMVIAFIQGNRVTVVRAPHDLASPAEPLPDSAAQPLMAYDLSIAIDGTGAPVLALAWNGAIQLWRWGGARWETLGPSAPDDRWSISPSLSFDADGRAVLAWASRTRLDPPPNNRVWYVVRAGRLDADAWTDLGALHDEALDGTWPSLALASDGTPLVSYWDATTLETTTVVKAWSEAGWGVIADSGLWGYPSLVTHGDELFLSVTDYDGARVLQRAGDQWIAPLGDVDFPVRFEPGERSDAFAVDDRGRPAHARIHPTGALSVWYSAGDDARLEGSTVGPVFPSRRARAPAIALENVDTSYAPSHWYMHLAWIEEGDDGEALLFDTFLR